MEHDYKDLELYLQQAQEEICITLNKSPTADTSFSGDETTSVDTGIGSSDEPCISPTSPCVKRGKAEPKESEHISFCTSENLDKRGVIHTDEDSVTQGSILTLNNGDICVQPELITNHEKDLLSTTGLKAQTGHSFEGITEIKSEVTNKKLPVLSVKKEACTATQMMNRNYSAEADVQDSKILLPNTKSECVVIRSCGILPASSCKSDDIELFIPPPPPLSPSSEDIGKTICWKSTNQNYETGVTSPSLTKTVVANSTKMEISGNMEIRLSDININQVRRDSNGNVSPHAEKTSSTTIQKGVCKVVIWEPRERNPQFKVTQSTQTYKGSKSDSVVPGKRKMKERRKSQDMEKRNSYGNKNSIEVCSNAKLASKPGKEINGALSSITADSVDKCHTVNGICGARDNDATKTISINEQQKAARSKLSLDFASPTKVQSELKSSPANMTKTAPNGNTQISLLNYESSPISEKAGYSIQKQFETVTPVHNEGKPVPIINDSKEKKNGQNLGVSTEKPTKNGSDSISSSYRLSSSDVHHGKADMSTANGFFNECMPNGNVNNVTANNTATSPLNNVQSPVTSDSQLGTPNTPTTLLDSLHRKYYAHQYGKDKCYSQENMCNTDKLTPGHDPFDKMLPSSMSMSWHPSAMATTTDVDPFDKMLPMSMSASWHEKSGLYNSLTRGDKSIKSGKHKTNGLSTGSIKSKLKPIVQSLMKSSPVNSPVKEGCSIAQTERVKDSKQKKSKHSIVSFSSFRNKIKPEEVLENKYALDKSPPPKMTSKPNGLPTYDFDYDLKHNTLPKNHSTNKEESSMFIPEAYAHSLPKSKSEFANLKMKAQNSVELLGVKQNGGQGMSQSVPAVNVHVNHKSMPMSRSICESIPENDINSVEDVSYKGFAEPISRNQNNMDSLKMSNAGVILVANDKTNSDLDNSKSVSSSRNMQASSEEIIVSLQQKSIPTGNRNSSHSEYFNRTRAKTLPPEEIKEDEDCIMLRKPRANSVPRVQADQCLHSVKAAKEQAEIEAVEACKWLRAAGFPQYAQMYEDLQFPIEISAVEKDHDFLDKDSIQSLFRRLNTLNKCASMKIEAPPRKLNDDSDDEEQCALSDKWKYQRSSRRWSRLEIDVNLANADCIQGEQNAKKETMRSCSSHDSVLTDNDSLSQQEDSPLLDSKEPHSKKLDLFIPRSSPEDVFITAGDRSLKSDRSGSPNSPTSPRILRRAMSERVKGPSGILKRIENLTTGKRKKQRSLRGENVEISKPVLTDSPEMQERLQRLGCVDITPTSEEAPLLPGETRNRSMTDSVISSPTSGDFGCDGDKSPIINNNTIRNSSPPKGDENADLTKTLPNNIKGLEEFDDLLQEFVIQPEHKSGTFPRIVSNGYISTGHGSSVNARTGSFNMGSESDDSREQIIRRREKREKHRSADDADLESNRMSIYDNVPENGEMSDAQKELDLILNGLFQDINGLSLMLNESSGTASDDPSSDTISMDDLMLLGSPVTPEFQQADILDKVSSEHDPDLDQLSAVSISSNQELSDPDQDISDLKDEGLENVICHERRDSGVGSSLTRERSERRRPRIRWHSFQKSHRPSLATRNLQISSVSAGQLVVLRKLSLLKMTALMERYSPTNRTGWNWVMPKFIKKFKAPDYKDKNVFGVPLLVILQRTSQPLPQCILYAMRYLRRTATDAVGIFRKSGVRSRIQKLRNQLETNPDLMNFDSLQAYDVADLLKQYFRELPECLLTNKLSETFISIHQFIPAELRLEALQAAIMLLPDENREVLQSLLLFLGDMADHSDENQMTASNLAVCFAPSLFHMCGPRNNQSTASPKRGRKTTNLGIPDQKELLEQKAAHECLTQMVIECNKLFMIPEDTMMKCRFSYMEQGDPVSLEDLIRDRNGDITDYGTHIESWIQGLLKESREKFKGWINIQSDDNTELAYKKVGDGHPLRLWKCSIDVEAPPVEVLNRVLKERHLWDDDLLKWRCVQKLDEQTEVYQYVCNSMAPHPSRDYCELRAWRSDLPKGSCVLVMTSIEHPEAPLLGGVRGVVLASRWLIEPCGSGRSRLTHISRVDTRGRTSEWYNKAYGHIAANYVARIAESFRLATNISTEGPETKI